jgi:hypothetical protein
MSLLIDVVAMSLPDIRSEVRGQIAEVSSNLNLIPCLLSIFVWFVAAFCGSGF